MPARRLQLVYLRQPELQLTHVIVHPQPRRLRVRNHQQQRQVACCIVRLLIESIRLVTGVALGKRHLAQRRVDRGADDSLRWIVDDETASPKNRSCRSSRFRFSGCTHLRGCHGAFVVNVETIGR